MRGGMEMLKKALSRIRKEKPTGTPWMKC